VSVYPIQAVLAGAILALSYPASPAAAQSAPPAAAACPTISAPQWAADPQSVFVVSTREASCSNGVLSFTAKRADQVNFAQATGSASSTIFAGGQWEDWWAAFQERLRLAPTHRALIFVHGYNNSAVTAVNRARAIRTASGFDGPIVAFLWPSQHDFIAYTVDETNAEWATTYLRWFLNAMLAAPSNTTIVSHSMGNRLTWTAIRELGLANPALASKIGHFVMASADVDRGSLVRDLTSDFAPLPDVTMYASSDDAALIYSSAKHGHARAGYLGSRHDGQTPATFRVDATNAKLIDTSTVRHKLPLAHGDFIETAEGAADLCRVISGADPSVGRADANLPRTWQLIRHPNATDICAQQGALASFTR
jgi:esterase/lipase superfamily enzyme